MMIMAAAAAAAAAAAGGFSQSTYPFYIPYLTYVSFQYSQFCLPDPVFLSFQYEQQFRVNLCKLHQVLTPTVCTYSIYLMQVHLVKSTCPRIYLGTLFSVPSFRNYIGMKMYLHWVTYLRFLGGFSRKTRRGRCTGSMKYTSSLQYRWIDCR